MATGASSCVSNCRKPCPSHADRLTADQAGQVTFQLHGNGYRFDAGHTVKLVLLGSDEPYLRKSSDAVFTVEVSDLTATHPPA